VARLLIQFRRYNHCLTSAPIVTRESKLYKTFPLLVCFLSTTCMGNGHQWITQTGKRELFANGLGFRNPYYNHLTQGTHFTFTTLRREPVLTVELPMILMLLNILRSINGYMVGYSIILCSKLRLLLLEAWRPVKPSGDGNSIPKQRHLLGEINSTPSIGNKSTAFH
jgi:hypothetical protein